MNFNFTKNIGMLLLSIYLILMGLAAIIPTVFAQIPLVIFGLLGLAAGVFILIGR